MIVIQGNMTRVIFWGRRGHSPVFVFIVKIEVIIQFYLSTSLLFMILRNFWSSSIRFSSSCDLWKSSEKLSNTRRAPSEKELVRFMIRNNCSIGKDAFSLYLASFWVQFELFLMCNRNKGSFSLHYNFDLI